MYVFRIQAECMYKNVVILFESLCYFKILKKYNYLMVFILFSDHNSQQHDYKLSLKENLQ